MNAPADPAARAEARGRSLERMASHAVDQARQDILALVDEVLTERYSAAIGAMARAAVRQHLDQARREEQAARLAQAEAARRRRASEAPVMRQHSTLYRDPARQDRPQPNPVLWETRNGPLFDDSARAAAPQQTSRGL